jgi:hypothetical protein
MAKRFDAMGRSGSTSSAVPWPQRGRLKKPPKKARFLAGGAMCVAPIVLLVVLSGCASTSPLATTAPLGAEELSATPGGVELAAWCSMLACENRQMVTDVAEAHCQQTNRKARLARSYVYERSPMPPRQKWYYRFDCVP